MIFALSLALAALAHPGAQSVAHQRLSLSVHAHSVELRYQSELRLHSSLNEEQVPSLDELESALLLTVNGERLDLRRVQQTHTYSDHTARSTLVLRGPLDPNDPITINVSTGNFPDVASRYSWTGWVDERWQVRRYSYWHENRAQPHLGLVGERYREMRLELSPAAGGWLRVRSPTHLNDAPPHEGRSWWPEGLALCAAAFALQAARQAKR